eukprot:COSAG02_NODE_46788_length_346_cov_0.631579_1_plen_90_part_01
MIDSKSAMSKRPGLVGEPHPVEWVFALTRFFPPTPQKEQPAGFEQKLLLPLNAHMRPEWVDTPAAGSSRRITRHVQLYDGEVGGPGIRTF